MTAREKLVAATEAQSTPVLMGAIVTLERKGGEYTLGLSTEERLVLHTMTDVVVRRHDLDDAVDEILLSDDFVGTYGDALLLALDGASVSL